MSVMDVLAKLAKGKKGKTKVSCEGNGTQTLSLTTKTPFVVTSMEEASKGFAKTGGTVGVKGTTADGLDVVTSYEVGTRDAASLVFVYGQKAQDLAEGEALAIKCGAIVDGARLRQLRINERAATLLSAVQATEATNAAYNHVERKALETAAQLISEDVENGNVEAGEMASAFRALIEKEFPRPDARGVGAALSDVISAEDVVILNADGKTVRKATEEEANNADGIDVVSVKKGKKGWTVVDDGTKGAVVVQLITAKEEAPEPASNGAAE